MYRYAPFVLGLIFVLNNQECCNGSCDNDNDGWTTEEGDCDDNNAAVHPGATEVCGDGLDNDCDGQGCSLAGTVGLGDANAKLAGEHADDIAGSEITVADFNMDGQDDVAIGSQHDDNAGAVYIVFSPFSGTLSLSQAGVKIVGEHDSDHAGIAIASGDVNGDGAADLLISASYEDSGGSNAGAVYLVYGPFSNGTIDLSQADAKLLGERSDDRAGCAVASAGDVNGDGYDDVLVGAYYEDTGGSSAGAAYLLYGPLSGTIDLSQADAKLIGENASDAAGLAVSMSGDVNADGYDDVLIGAYGQSSGGSGSGAAYLLYGPLSGTIDLSLADAKFVGENAGDRAGISVSLGDVDNDGDADLLIGADYEDSGGSAAGAAYVLYGPREGTIDLSTADAKLIGENAGDFAGRPVSLSGDINGDGYADLFLGAWQAGEEDSDGDGAGAAYVLYGPVVGMVDLSEADVKLTGEHPGDLAGFAISSEGDLNGDGLPDLVVGAIYEDSAGTDAGAAYVVNGKYF